MKAAAFVVALALTSVGATAAQEKTPAFEVVSIKPSSPDPNSPLGMVPLVRPAGSGRFSATNMPLRLLVRMAYGVQDFQIDGGPPWQLSQRFDITAKAEDGYVGDAQSMLPMVKTLLADRFKLKVHAEMREMPVYALVVARDDGKLGPNLKPSMSDCSNAANDNQKLADALAKGGPGALAGLLSEKRPCTMSPMMAAGGFGMRADGQPLSALVPLLTQATGRMVRDRTGLTGLYDWEIKFDPQVLLQIASQVGINLPGGATSPSSDSPSLMTALREDLGLKLNAERDQVEVIVIDGAEMPEPN